ncbi:MAG: hypothetical protein K2X66_15065 [Cyanobacteria bacterium]|nr:hypothetical protein [Cyanobacteriota bacterium]
MTLVNYFSIGFGSDGFSETGTLKQAGTPQKLSPKKLSSSLNVTNLALRFRASANNPLTPAEKELLQRHSFLNASGLDPKQLEKPLTLEQSQALLKGLEDAIPELKLTKQEQAAVLPKASLQLEWPTLLDCWETLQNLHVKLQNHVISTVQHTPQNMARLYEDTLTLAANPQQLFMKGLAQVDPEMEALIRHIDQEGVGGEFEFLFKPLRGISEKPLSKGLEAFLKIESGHHPALRQKVHETLFNPSLWMQVPGFMFKSATEKLKVVVEMSESVGLGKFTQIIADEPTIPKQLKGCGTLLKSKGTPSRTLAQAQQFTDSLYGKDKYILKALLGVGTIGETYLAETKFYKNREGQPSKFNASSSSPPKEVVVKMLKENITPERISLERKAAIEYIQAFCAEDVDKDYYSKMVDSLYQGWMNELDFGQEYISAYHLAKDASRFKVANPIEVGYKEVGGPGVSLVAEKASGLSLDHLIPILELYRQSPKDYPRVLSERYGPLVSKYPWLQHPEKWIEELPLTFLSAQNEQTLFIPNSGRRIAHGDPHSGNLFVDFPGWEPNQKLKRSKTLKPSLTYIDTGLMTVRNQEEVINHLGIFLDLITGNYKSLAERIIKTAEYLPPQWSREELENELTKRLEKGLFPSAESLTDLKQINQIINRALRELRIIQNKNEAVFFKSQFQTLITFIQLSQLAGKDFKVIQRSLVDITRGVVLGMLRSPNPTFQTLWSSFGHLYRKPSRALRVLYKFIQDPSSDA